MGEVYAATDRRLQREVAVKLLRADLADQPAMCRRFEDEARTVARLSHPNVVAIFDTGVESGRPYLVMERLPGTTLAGRLATGPLNEVATQQLALDVLAALAAAHAAGIVHRDVKPANVLFAAEGRAKVTDFGIAKVAEDLDQTTTAMLLGTPVYMAPERLRGAPATPRCDLYSLGVVLYEALSGRKAFAGADPVVIAHRIDRGELVPLEHLRPELSSGLVDVVHRSMHPDPDQRFASASEMADAIDGLLPDDATTEVGGTATTQALPRSSVPARAQPPGRASWRPITIALATLVVIATLAVGAWALQRDTAPTPAPTPSEVPADGHVPPDLRDALDRLADTVQP
jgi:serine/threonine-protein kinase